MADTIFSSFAYPGFFPPSKAFGSEWFDGASVNTLDVLTAIDRCKKLGFTQDTDIVIDIILTQGANLTRVDASDYRSLGMLFRFIEIYSYYGSMNGLERAKFSHPNVTYRHVIAPTINLPSSIYPMNLNSTDIITIIE